MEVEGEDTGQGAGASALAIGRSCQSPPTPASIRSSRSEREARWGARGRRAPLIGCRWLPGRAAGLWLPHPRVSPAFFGPLRISSKGHSAEGSTAYPTTSIAGCVPGSVAARPVAFGVAKVLRLLEKKLG